MGQFTFRLTLIFQLCNKTILWEDTFCIFLFRQGKKVHSSSVFPQFLLNINVFSSRVLTLATWPGRLNERTWAVWTHSVIWRSVLLWRWMDGSTHWAESSSEWPSPRECAAHLSSKKTKPKKTNSSSTSPSFSGSALVCPKKGYFGTEHDQSSSGLPVGPEGAGACCLVLWLALRGPHWWIHDFCSRSWQKG